MNVTQHSLPALCYIYTPAPALISYGLDARVVLPLQWIIAISSSIPFHFPRGAESSRFTDVSNTDALLWEFRRTAGHNPNAIGGPEGLWK